MSVSLIGSSTVAEVETNSKALRVVPYPLDDGSLMTGSIGTQTGTIAAALAAQSEIYQFRWTSSNLGLIKRIKIGAGSIVAFTAGIVVIDAVVARSFTVAGTGGGTATLTGNNNKLRTSMATTAVAEVRTATTAALGTGTKTLDSQAFAAIGHGIANVAGNPVVPAGTILWEAPPGEYPLVLAANEGFVIRATVPATGTWTAAISVDWVEVSAFAP